MSSDFDRLLAELTKKGDPKVHGVLMKCVDKNGASCSPSPNFKSQKLTIP